MSPNAGFEPQLQALIDLLTACKSVLVCFSGGTDSAFVLNAANIALGASAAGLTGVSASLADREREMAIKLATAMNARHYLVPTRELEDENYLANPANRCFFCKSELYRVAQDFAAREGFAVIVNGSNVDDLGDYRPGLDAAKNFGVRSPLIEVGMTKADVRRHAKALGLEVWNKPASACLASRLPYGTSIRAEMLHQIGEFEAGLQDLGFSRVRVRVHETLARIELDPSELVRAASLASKLAGMGKALGFSNITLDLQGYRMGSHNELLAGNTLRIVPP